MCLALPPSNIMIVNLYFFLDFLSTPKRQMQKFNTNLECFSLFCECFFFGYCLEVNVLCEKKACNFCVNFLRFLAVDFYFFIVPKIVCIFKILCIFSGHLWPTVSVLDSTTNKEQSLTEI